ncbi:hypothetical protein CLOM_g19669 [Closterium sp. NIES-68]|nr:hypothetical protein CLOM_g19669 [Closterium sp. NIES-68]
MGLLRHVKQGLAVSLDGELVMSGRWSGGRVLDACGCRKELVLRNGDDPHRLLVEVDVVPLDGDEVGVAEKCREHEEWDQSFLIFCRAARLKEGVCHGVHLVERQGFLRPGGARAVAFGEFTNL